MGKLPMPLKSYSGTPRRPQRLGGSLLGEPELPALTWLQVQQPEAWELRPGQPPSPSSFSVRREAHCFPILRSCLWGGRSSGLFLT